MPIYALVLTSPPRNPSLSELVVERALRQIPLMQRGEAFWLAPREAWQALFEAEDWVDAARLRADVAFALKGLTCDVNVVLAEPGKRRIGLLVADMESTIIEQECLDELADLVGLRERISDITARAMRGDLDFEQAIKERVALLAGLEASALERIYQDRVTLMPGAEVLIRTLKRDGVFCALVSGGFTFFTDRIASRLGFDASQANRLEIDGDKIAGAVGEPILGREAKRAALEGYAKTLRLPASATMAVGDGANDLAMIKAAGCGVAFKAKPLVAAQAAASITKGDLTALLFLQGYRRDEFAA